MPMPTRNASLLRWFSVGCLSGAACLVLLPALRTDTHQSAAAAEKPPAAHAALDRVDELAGSIRYDGKKVVGVQAEKIAASDEDVKVLAALTDVEELSLRGEAITDAAVGYLASLPNLHHLSFEGTSITDAGVARLKQLRGLRRLDLGSAAQLTDAALVHLAALAD